MNTPNQDNLDDEMLMALADGELDSATARDLRARIARDPDLAARYAVFAETSAALRAAFAQDEVPDRLVDAIRTAPIGDAPEMRQPPAQVVPLHRRAAWPMALAASLAMGVGLGWIIPAGPGSTAMSLDDVANALSDVPTGQSRDMAGLGPARVLGSFETEQGLCRLMSVQPAQSAPRRFVACREGVSWTVALSVVDGSRDGFSPASDTATEMLDLYLDAIGAGASLAPQRERDALD